VTTVGREGVAIGADTAEGSRYVVTPEQEQILDLKSNVQTQGVAQSIFSDFQSNPNP